VFSYIKSTFLQSLYPFKSKWHKLHDISYPCSYKLKIFLLFCLTFFCDHMNPSQLRNIRGMRAKYPSSISVTTTLYTLLVQNRLGACEQNYPFLRTSYCPHALIFLTKLFYRAETWEFIPEYTTDNINVGMAFFMIRSLILLSQNSKPITTLVPTRRAKMYLKVYMYSSSLEIMYSENELQKNCLLISERQY
jgi:hypothetical protein